MKARLLQRLARTNAAAAGIALVISSGGVQALSTGVDLNLTTHTAAGGMGGAAYTKPQEVSAAIFGNPATLTQFGGVSHNFNATYLRLESIEFISSNTNDATGTTSDPSASSKSDFFIPNIGTGLQLSPNIFVGIGIEADAGLGADYRENPLHLAGQISKKAGALGLGDGSDPAFPLLVELISFNVNIAAAMKVTDKLSVGLAPTIAFGFLQLGSAGPTSGLANLDNLTGNILGLSDFGGTASSVNTYGWGYSLGVTYEYMPGITLSGAYKSETRYNFNEVLYTAVEGKRWQDLRLELPRDIITGVAFENVFMPDTLVEIDYVFKNYGDANAFEDVWKDQHIINLGAQFNPGGGVWTFRAGYNYASELLRETPNNTLGSLTGIGSLPLGKAADRLQTKTALPYGDLATDFLRGVQMSLLPVTWQHNVTVGGGFKLNPAVTINAFSSFGLGENSSRSAPTVDFAIENLVAGGGVATNSTTVFENDNGLEWAFGASINVLLP